MAKAKKRVTRWADGETDIEELGPNERIAHELVSEFADLSPSVEKIMDAEISEEGRGEALELFRSSLGSIGDPNRDPRVAIVTAGGTPPPPRSV